MHPTDGGMRTYQQKKPTKNYQIYSFKIQQYQRIKRPHWFLKAITAVSRLQDAFFSLLGVKMEYVLGEINVL